MSDGGLAGVGAPSIPCLDSLDDVYVTPAGLPPMTDANRGDIVRCAPDAQLSVSDVQGQLAGKGVTGVTAISGARSYRVAYRTTRDDGVDGVGTARLFLPDAPRAAPLPVIVTAHGSDGLGPSCAPSKDPTGNAELSMPFAGNGYAVIAPDYAGLGNEGTQGYLDNRDTAHSVLDAARALRKLLPAAFSRQVILVGFSQGGGGVLSAQALAQSYGADGEVIGAVVFAAQWQSRLDSFGYLQALNDPGGLTILDGVAKPPIYVMRQYAYQMNEVGPATGGDGFPAAKAGALAAAAQSQCLAEVGAAVQAIGPHLGDLIEPSLAAGLLDCADGGPCAGAGQALYEYLSANILTGDPRGAPVVYIQGLADVIMPPAEEAACNLAKLEADGLSPQLCTDAAAQHTDVVARNAAYAVGWVEARLAGVDPPPCPSMGLPACAP